MLEIPRWKRFAAALLNWITMNGLLVGGLVLLITKRTSLGGLVMGYKFEGGHLAALWAMKLVTGIITAITFGIFALIDFLTMGNRNGTFAESWSGTLKAKD